MPIQDAVPGIELVEMGLIQRIEIRKVATVATPRSVLEQGKDKLRLRPTHDSAASVLLGRDADTLADAPNRAPDSHLGGASRASKVRLAAPAPGGSPR
jgi:hypothetical protein